VGAMVASIVMALTTHHPPTLARPRSVITKRTTPNDRPAASMVSDFATSFAERDQSQEHRLEQS
jgi:hypothetical protein